MLLGINPFLFDWTPGTRLADGSIHFSLVFRTNFSQHLLMSNDEDDLHRSRYTISSNHNVHKSFFGLSFWAPDHLIDRLKKNLHIKYQSKGLELKNKGNMNFYECCDLKKKYIYRRSLEVLLLLGPAEMTFSCPENERRSETWRPINCANSS